MPMAARINDKTTHGGTIGPPKSAKAMTVLVQGLPAAVVSAQHVCVIPPHAIASVANLVLPGKSLASRVFVGGLPAAVVGDQTSCGAQIIPIPPLRTVFVGGPL